MPDVAIARYDATTGWLPPICPKHGCQADRTMTRKYSTPIPPWMYVLILAGFLIFVIAVYSVRKSDDVAIPACGICAESIGRRNRMRWASGIAFLVLIIAGIGTNNGFFWLLALFALIAVLLCFSSLLDPMAGVSGRIDGPWLRLKGVHPAWIAAQLPNPAWNQPRYLPPTQGLQPAVQWQQPYFH